MLRTESSPRNELYCSNIVSTFEQCELFSFVYILNFDYFKDFRVSCSRKMTERKIKTKRACVVVLGDIGRSPRMQYHTKSLAENNLIVDLIGYVSFCLELVF